MRAFLQTVRDVLLCALLLSILLCAWDVHRSLQNTAGQARYTLDNANRLIRELAQTSANLRHATAEWESASKQQAAYFTTATQKTNADLDALRDLVDHTDQQINGQLLPALTAGVILQSNSLASIEKQTSDSLAELQRVTAQLEPVLQNAAQATAGAAKLSADPAIAETIAHIDDLTASMSSAAASVDRQVRMIEPVTKKATTPASLTARIFNTAIDLAAKFGSMFAGFAK
jgi:ABC-type transporter Mla subunit MlaD